MANDASKVLVGSGKVGGYLFSAPLGTAIPTDASTELDPAFVGLGYVSSDGLTRTVDVSTEDVQDLNLDIVRTLTTDTSVELSGAMLEVNAALLKELYGEDNVTEAGSNIAVRFTGEALPRKTYVYEMVDGENIGRFVIGEGQVTTPGGGELTFVKGAALQHTLTIRAYRSETGEYFSEYHEAEVSGS